MLAKKSAIRCNIIACLKSLAKFVSVPSCQKKIAPVFMVGLYKIIYLSRVLSQINPALQGFLDDRVLEIGLNMGVGLLQEVVLRRHREHRSWHSLGTKAGSGFTTCFNFQTKCRIIAEAEKFCHNFDVS